MGEHAEVVPSAGVVGMPFEQFPVSGFRLVPLPGAVQPDRRPQGLVRRDLGWDFVHD